MNLREPYKNVKTKSYDDLKSYFLKEITFNKGEQLKNSIISDLEDISRVWLLFAKNKDTQWRCLQVAQSKNDAIQEVKGVLDYIKLDYMGCKNNKNSAFYENVCPKGKGEYRKMLYSKIGSEYSKFKICFLDVDKYLGLNRTDCTNKCDGDRIIEICKYKYAEAKIAYQTLAVYWRQYRSCIDGQTISYIAEHPDEFINI